MNTRSKTKSLQNQDQDEPKEEEQTPPQSPQQTSPQSPPKKTREELYAELAAGFGGSGLRRSNESLDQIAPEAKSDRVYPDLSSLQSDLIVLSSPRQGSSSSSIDSDLNNTFYDSQKVTPAQSPTEEKGIVNKLKMTTEDAKMVLVTNGVTFKDALAIIPRFDGKPSLLTSFIEACREASAMVGKEQEKHLAKIVKAKLEGEARQSVVGEDFKDLEHLIEHLRDIYGSQQTMNQLLGELGSEFQKENEKVITFFNRLKQITLRIVDAYKRENNTEESRLQKNVG